MDIKLWLRSNWERLLGTVCLATGVVATVLAYLGVRSSPHLVEDISYIISGGVGGLLLVGLTVPVSRAALGSRPILGFP